MTYHGLCAYLETENRFHKNRIISRSYTFNRH